MAEIKQLLNRKTKSALNYIFAFIKWTATAALTGAVGGIVGTLFHKAVDSATLLRENNDWLIFLLPAAGLIIVGLYKLCKIDSGVGTNQVIDSIRTKNLPPPLLAPLIFVSTALTHLCGGSAGREGAALQLGGAIGAQIGKFFKFDDKDMHMIVMCGMSSVFAALFGTPITAMMFAIEVISVGEVYYSALIPCITSSLTAYAVAVMSGVAPMRFALAANPALSPITILQTVLLSALCAVLSIVFCQMIKYTYKFAAKKIKNEWLRIVIGAAVIILLTFLLQTRDYNGAGMNVITRALSGSALPYAFALKLLFTVITLAAGFKGGEIVPTLFIGSAFGCTVGALLGLDPGFGAAIGMISLFCGVVNCPLASVFLSVELFGAQNITLFCIACGVSYMLSGYYSLYSSQKIVYSKLKAEFININAK